MTRISFSKEGTTPFQQLLGHNKDVLQKWTSLGDVLFDSNTFSDELKEEVRRTLAFNNGCQYCMSKGSPSENIANLKISTAVKFANMISNNNNIDDKEFNIIKSIFNDEEISELCSLICFITACQKLGATLDLQASCTL